MITYYRDKPKSLPTAVLIDTDNTLYAYEPARIAAENFVFDRIHEDYSIPHHEVSKLFDQSRLYIKSRLGPTPSSHSRLLYFQRLIELLDNKTNLLAALDYEQTFWREFLFNAPLFPGVQAFIDAIQALGIPIAVVTDLTSHIQLKKLCFFNLQDTFDAVVTSEEVGYDKPDPRNFDLALTKLNIPPSDLVWMIGDSSAADICGGLRYGLYTLQKVHQGVHVDTTKHIPHCTFSSYYSLTKLLKSLST